MLSGHFESVNVDVEIVDISDETPLQNIKITASVYSNNIAFDVGRLLTLVKNRISKIEDI